MDKTALIEQCKKGDRGAYHILYEAHAAKALRTVYLLVGNKNIAEDIVQEAFIQCFQNIGALKKADAFEAWFYRLLTRISFRMGSRESRISTSDSADCEQIVNIGAAACDEPLQMLQLNETRKEVRQALDNLSLPVRTVIVLHYFNDMSIKDIAKVLGCFEGTVKSRLHNGRKQLRIWLFEVDFSYENREECTLHVNAKYI